MAVKLNEHTHGLVRRERSAGDEDPGVPGDCMDDNMHMCLEQTGEDSQLRVDNAAQLECLQVHKEKGEKDKNDKRKSNGDGRPGGDPNDNDDDEHGECDKWTTCLGSDAE